VAFTDYEVFPVDLFCFLLPSDHWVKLTVLCPHPSILVAGIM
jgi:hypothetical protein